MIITGHQERNSEKGQTWVAIVVNLLAVLAAAFGRKFGLDVTAQDLAVLIGGNSLVAANYAIGRTLIKRKVLSREIAAIEAPAASAPQKTTLPNPKPAAVSFPESVPFAPPEQISTNPAPPLTTQPWPDIPRD